MYTALPIPVTWVSLVFSTNAVCVKTQQIHSSTKHHDKTKQEYNQLKNIHSYATRTLRASRSQFELTILKIRESSAHALYNCTPNK